MGSRGASSTVAKSVMKAHQNRVDGNGCDRQAAWQFAQGFDNLVDCPSF
jgi:hypothetical protein